MAGGKFGLAIFAESRGSDASFLLFNKKNLHFTRVPVKGTHECYHRRKTSQSAFIWIRKTCCALLCKCANFLNLLLKHQSNSLQQLGGTWAYFTYTSQYMSSNTLGISSQTCSKNNLFPFYWLYGLKLATSFFHTDFGSRHGLQWIP